MRNYIRVKYSYSFEYLAAVICDALIESQGLTKRPKGGRFRRALALDGPTFGQAFFSAL